MAGVNRYKLLGWTRDKSQVSVLHRKYEEVWRRRVSDCVENQDDQQNREQRYIEV